MLNFNKKRLIFVNEVLTFQSSGKFSEQIINMGIESNDPIFIIINSTGGNIRALNTIIAAMKFTKCDIITIATGFVASSAAILFLNGCQRYIIPGAVLLFHEPSDQFKESAYQYSEILNKLKDLEEDYDFIINQIASNTNLSREEVITKIKGEFLLTAQEAVNIGAATNIISSVEQLK